jgi:phosphoserine aminotransferase
MFSAAVIIGFTAASATADGSRCIQGGSMSRVYNFNSGPATLPEVVLEQARAEMLDYAGTGMSVLEISHRSPQFERLLNQASDDLRALLSIPANYRVLFLQGGATLQFAMAPMNLRPAGAAADYILTGAWAKAAIREAEKLGRTRAVGSTEQDNFNRLPDTAELDFDPKAAYWHFTANETIQGLEWAVEPSGPENVPVVCDASSNVASKPIDVSKYGVIYAGAQKNLGPAGAVLVIIRDDLLGKVPPGLPVMLDYRVLAESNSLHNTPPCFAIYIVGLVLNWLKMNGGVEGMARHNAEKAALIYNAIDSSGGFYRGHAQPPSRSRMNVTFRLPSEELEERFVKQAEAQRLIGLKGHRSVGGLRASMYNAFPVEGARALAQFMAEFQRANG